MKGAHQGCVDRRHREVEVGQLLDQRQLGRRETIADRADPLFRHFGLEQVAKDPLDRMLAADGVGHDLVVGGPHAGQLQVTSSSTRPRLPRRRATMASTFCAPTPSSRCSRWPCANLAHCSRPVGLAQDAQLLLSRKCPAFGPIRQLWVHRRRRRHYSRPTARFRGGACDGQRVYNLIGHNHETFLLRPQG